MILEKFIETKAQPLLNYMQGVVNSPNFSSLFHDYMQIMQKTRIKNLVFRSPEAMMLVDAVTADICSGYHFEPLKGTGRNRIQYAEKFARKINHKKLRKNTVVDMLVTGEGFQHLSKLNDAQAKEILNVMIKELQNAGYKAKAADYDEDLVKPRELKWIASSTMVTLFDQYDVKGYLQRVGAREVQFNTDEIIKFSFGEIDGKVLGYTPFMTLTLHLEILWLLWLNQYYRQSKGNAPDRVFMVEGMDMNNPAFNKLSEEIKMYNHPGSPNHGNLVLSGPKVTVTQLEEKDGLMFAEVDRYITTIAAGQWQFPLSRLGIKTDEASKGKDGAGSSDQGYWNMIEQKQDMIAEIENSQIWEPFFGVKLVPDKAYKHDQVVEGTAQQLRLGNLEMQNRILAARQQQMSDEVFFDLLNGRDADITPDDVEDLEVDPMQMQTGMLRQGMQPNDSGKGMSNSDRADKRADEISRERNTGKPSGV